MGRNVRPMEFPFWKGITVGQSRVPGYPLTATRNPIPLSFSFPIKENQNCKCFHACASSPRCLIEMDRSPGIWRNSTNNKHTTTQDVWSKWTCSVSTKRRVLDPPSLYKVQTRIEPVLSTQQVTMRGTSGNLGTNF